MDRASALRPVWLAALLLLMAPRVGLTADAPTVRIELDGDSASLRAPLAPNWSLRTTLSGRHDSGGSDPLRTTLHRASMQAGLAYDLAPQAQFELALQRGLSPDMPARSLALNWRLRY